MATTRSLELEELGDRRSSSESRSNHKERKTVGENKAMIGARYGYDFVDLITMAIILKAGSMMKEDELFSCEISKEDATAGKFDAIVFRYTYKGTRTILKIQVKHRTINQKVSLQELMTTSFREPFALIKYFKSFHEQYTPSNEKQIFVLCTNVQLENDAVEWLEKVHPNDVCNVFDPIGATYYRFRKISEVEPRNSNCIANALEKVSEFYRLADILAKLIYEENELFTKNNDPLLSKYKNPIVRHMMEYSKASKAIHIKHNFRTNTDRNVVNFRKQFETAYTEIAMRSLKKTAQDLAAENFDVYGDIAKKPIKTNDPKKMIEHVRYIHQNNILSDFPADIVTDEGINMFFDKLLIVCDTFSTDDLPSKIAEMWRSSKICKPTELVCSLETEKYIEGLHRIVSKWMRSSPNLPTTLEAKHVEEITKKVQLHQKYLLLKKASNKYIADHLSQSLRAKPESLREKPLYKFLTPSDPETNMTKPDIFTFLTPYNSQFSSMIVLQTFQLLERDADQIFFIDINTIEKEQQIILDMCEFFEDPLVMVIDCEVYEPLQLNQLKQTLIQSILANRNVCIKIILLEKSQNKTFDEEFCFLLRDFEPSSVETLIRANGWNTLFGTSVPAVKVFIRETDDVSVILNFIEDQHKFLPNSCLVDDYYKRIILSYVQRRTKYDSDASDEIDKFWIFKELPNTTESNMIPWKSFYQTIHKKYSPSDKYDMERIKAALENRIAHELPGGKADWQQKVHILLGEAGCGKSSYISWLGWYVQDSDRFLWVIRFNAIDYSTDFGRLSCERTQLNGTKAMRFFYRMIHLALFVRKMNQQTISTADEVRKEAEQCADLLEFCAASKAIIVNEEKWKSSGMTSLQLIMVRLFQEKFNGKSLIVLFDGFDEILPTYKEVASNLLTQIGEFEGVKRMYLTSRPYDLRQDFQQIFPGAKFHSFVPFSYADTLAVLHLFMKENFSQYSSHEIDQQICLLKILILTIAMQLKSLYAKPIYLKMAMDVLKPLVEKYVNFNDKTISTSIMQDLAPHFEKLQLVEQFVRKNLLTSNYEKNGIESMVYYPDLQSKLNEANEKTLRRHSVLALYVIFDADEREMLRTDDIKALKYMEKIKRGDEKTGIIEAVFDSKPLFIHRSFAEYFAALWLFENRMRPEVKLFLKSLSYWTVSRRDLREYFDRMLISKANCDLPIHMAIINRTLEYIAEELRDNDSFLKGKDLGGRTVFHLLANYYDSNTDEGDKANANMLDYYSDLDEKDEVLNWSALDYALIRMNHPATIYLLKFGARYDLRHLTQTLLNCDGEKMLKSIIEYEKFITYNSNLPIYRNIFNDNIMERFEKDVIKRVVDLAFSENMLHLAHSSFDDALVNHDAVFTLKTVYNRDPELFSACRIKELLIKAFDRCALYVVEYLVVECRYDLPLEVEGKKDVLFTMIQNCIARGCNELFTILYKSYSVRWDIEYNEPQPSANKNQDNLRFSEAPYKWNLLKLKKPETQIPLAMVRKAECVLPLLSTAIVYFNNCVIDNLFQIIKPNECHEIIRSLTPPYEYGGCLSLEYTSRLKYLIGKSTNLKYRNREGESLLHHFIQNGVYNLALFLIEEYGFDIGQADTKNGWNAFHHCANFAPMLNDPFEKEQIAIEEYKKLLNYMLAMKNAVLYLSAKDKQDRNVLHLAIENHNTCAVKIILHRNLENCDEPNQPAALVANIVGKTIDQLNDDTSEMTLLNYVIELKLYNLAIFLIEEYRFDIGQANTNNGWNAFHYCANIPYKEFNEVFMLFYYMKAKDHAILLCSAMDLKGRNVLHYAVVNGNSCIVNYILQNKLKECSQKDQLAMRADAYIRQTTHLLEGDAEGMTLLHFAIASRQYNLALLLIQKYDYNIGVTDTKNGWNTFHYCANIPYPEKNSIPTDHEYEYLLSHMLSMEHADLYLSAKDKHGRTVLHIALINGNVRIAHYILQRKLKECNQKDQLAALVDEYVRETTDLLKGYADGMTLLHFAIELKLYDLAIFLIEEYRFDIGKTDPKNGCNAFHYCANIRYTDKNSIPKEYEDLLCRMMAKAQLNHFTAKDIQGNNVMDIALNSGNFLIACYILELEQNESKECNELGRSTAMHANYIEYYTRLLETNVEGMTLLHFAIASGRDNLAIFLIQKYVFDIGKTDTKNG